VHTSGLACIVFRDLQYALPLGLKMSPANEDFSPALLKRIDAALGPIVAEDEAKKSTCLKS
jgi:hypothetical protein